MDRLAKFLFEVGMLKRTPRSGWQFLGTGSESVADHVFRMTMISFSLARLDGTVDADRAIRLALVHDLPEARTGDLNYMNQKYATADEESAAADMVRGLSFGDELDALLREYRDEATPEAILVHDADQLELLMSLKEQLDTGNPQAEDWFPFVLQRLRTQAGRDLATEILAGNSADWWFDRRSDWWVRGGKK
jgi:putative hydrolase of HD superfamily